MKIKIGDYVHFVTELEEHGYGKVVCIHNHNQYDSPYLQKYIVQLDMTRTDSYIGWDYNRSGEKELDGVLPKGYQYWWIRETEIRELNPSKIMDTE